MALGERNESEPYDTTKECILNFAIYFVACAAMFLPFGVLVVCSDNGGWLMRIAYIFSVMLITYVGYGSSENFEFGFYDILFTLFLVCTDRPLLFFEMQLFFAVGFYVGKIVEKYRRKNAKRKHTATNPIDVLVHDTTCTICREVTTGENLVVLPCRHAFHFNCMLNYVGFCDSASAPRSCPTCRCVIVNMG
jgi:hypothetical protein